MERFVDFGMFSTDGNLTLSKVYRKVLIEHGPLTENDYHDHFNTLIGEISEKVKNEGVGERYKSTQECEECGSLTCEHDESYVDGFNEVDDTNVIDEIYFNLKTLYNNQKELEPYFRLVKKN